MTPPSLRPWLLSMALLICLNACSEYEKIDINAVLDARDAAVSSHDIKAYDALLLPNYHDLSGQTEFNVVSKMNKLFAQFEQTEMISNHRIIRLLDNKHAECEQSYSLRVKADNTWRQLNQRERISLTKTADGWRISGGL